MFNKRSCQVRLNIALWSPSKAFYTFYSETTQQSYNSFNTIQRKKLYFTGNIQENNNISYLHQYYLRKTTHATTGVFLLIVCNVAFCHGISNIQWNPDFSNPHLYEPSDNSIEPKNKVVYLSSVEHWNFASDFSKYLIFRANFRFPQRFEKSGFHRTLLLMVRA